MSTIDTTTLLHDSLHRDALTVLQPGFVGTTPPDWLRRHVAAGLGSVALFSRNVTDQTQLAELTAGLREENPDLLLAIDEEGGDVTRLESGSGSSWPGNLALGAIDDPGLTRDVARELGRALAECGVNYNWAPSADVNSNPDNPVIGVRSFGADPDLCARHTAAWVEGLQSAGVAACAKHFPGHGDTAIDSHLGLPVVDIDVDLLRSRDLVPFKAAIAAGAKAVMTAHIMVPALDGSRPATLSRPILDLLRLSQAEGGLGYQGLIVTDAIEMGAIADTFGTARGTVLALAAGAAFAPITDSPYVLSLSPVANIAVGQVTPWGLAGMLAGRLPGTRTASHGPQDATAELLPGLLERVLADAAGRRVVVVVRDAHRHEWMTAVLHGLLAARPDAAVVEMGVPQAEPVGALHIATHGAARVCGLAAVEVLTGGLANSL